METINSALLPRFKLERSRHAAPQVFDHLRSLIIDLTLPPGTLLSRMELARHYDISQTPVRDALMRLAEEGLVDIFPQHATLVSRIDVARAQEAHFLRLAVETEIARTLAAQADLVLIERLRALVARQKRHAREKDLAGFEAADQEFHRQMYEAAQVPQLYPMIRSRSGHLDRLRRLHLPAPGKAAAVVADHGSILEAIGLGDAAAAEHAVRRHLSGTLANVEDIRRRHADYLLD